MWCYSDLNTVIKEQPTLSYHRCYSLWLSFAQLCQHNFETNREIYASLLGFTDYSKQCVKHGHEYFIDKFEGELKPTVQLCKAARYFDSCKLLELKFSCSDIKTL